MVSHAQRARAFGAHADVYEAGRPEYPADAIAWMLEPVGGHPRVADIGAGTGKLTRGLLAAGCDVVAVDPDPAMLTALRTAVPGVPTHAGTAEALPLADASVDAVVLGQAWHWVEPTAGCREIARVLRPGGVLAMVWNLRAEDQPWVRRLNTVIAEGTAQQMLAAGGPPVAAPFGDPQVREWAWTRPVTRDVIGHMVRSRSHFITAPPQRQAAVDAELTALCDDLGLHDDSTVDLPYRTRAYRTGRP